MARAKAAVADGSAEDAWMRWIEAQGGTTDESALEEAPVVREVTAPRAGTIVRLDANQVGVAALHLGAGRRVKSDTIDHAVGVVCRRKRGDLVEEGEVLAEVHARTDETAGDAAREVAAAYELGDQPGPARPLVFEVIS